MASKYKVLINGLWLDDFSEWIEVINPTTEEVIATVPKCKSSDVEKAVEAADVAFQSWSRLTVFQRGEYLRKASELVYERAESIAKTMSMEQGKPFKEALGEVKKGAEILRYYAEEGERVFGKIIPNSDFNTESRVIYQPMGVAAAISPWNYPIELIAWKVAGALASGCTIVCKLPSETPLSPLEYLRCLVDVGIPSGVVNALTGPGSDLGEAIMHNPKIKKVAFTGSTETGKIILANSVSTLKKVSLELGGSLPMIVTKNADLDAAVAGATRRSFRNMGQICIAINRIYVERSIYKEFLEKFKIAAEKLTIGNGLENDVDLGPMCRSNGISTVKSHIDDGVSKGAKLLTGGKRPAMDDTKGYFFEPSILADVTHDMLVMNEETFGPLVGVMPFDTLKEAIYLANDTVYGLAAMVYSNNLSEVEYLTKELHAGNVAVNNPDAGVINAPYGGWKDSGFGHEHGTEGLYEYLYIKHIRVRYL